MKTAEEILKEYIKFDDVNQSKTVELLPLTIVDAMEEYATQYQENMADKKYTEADIRKAIELARETESLRRGALSGDWHDVEKYDEQVLI